MLLATNFLPAPLAASHTDAIVHEMEKRRLQDSQAASREQICRAYIPKSLACRPASQLDLLRGETHAIPAAARTAARAAAATRAAHHASTAIMPRMVPKRTDRMDRDHALDNFDSHPWEMPRACTASDGSPAQIIAQHQTRAADAKAIVVAKTGGGLGNELNIVLHAFLEALVTGSRLLVYSRSNSTILRYLAPSPIWTFVDSETLNRLSMANVSVEVTSCNWMPFSPHDHRLWSQLWEITQEISFLVSCASHVLFQPGDAVERAMAPYLRKLDAPELVIGVHIRTSDAEMATRQNVATRRRLALDLNPRRGCASGISLIGEMVACTSSIMHHQGGNSSTVAYFVGTDSSRELRHVQVAFANFSNVRVLTSAGVPFHTGRPITTPLAGNDADPIVKALVDFFVLSRADHFFSNCDFLTYFKHTASSLWTSHTDQPALMFPLNSSHGALQKKRCGNTFTGNIWLRRFVLGRHELPHSHACSTGVPPDKGERAFGPPISAFNTTGQVWLPAIHEKKAPVSVSRALTGRSGVGTCVTEAVGKKRATHARFAPLGQLSRPPPSCGLRNYPELVEGPKKGDDDKRLCSSMLQALRPSDVIIIVGSNNEFGFEEQMLACTEAHIATFDCTVKEASNKPPTSRVSFLGHCIGPDDTAPGMAQFRTWESIAALALGAAKEAALQRGAERTDSSRPAHIAVLKADIEGWEWAVLDQVLGSAAQTLPQQVAIELHLRTQASRNVSGFDSSGVLRGSSQRLIQLRARCERAGYALVDRNDNPWCRHCSEVLFVKSTGPPAGAQSQR
jgi:hypothetical protein